MSFRVSAEGLLVLYIVSDLGRHQCVYILNYCAWRWVGYRGDRFWVVFVLSCVTSCCSAPWTDWAFRQLLGLSLIAVYVLRIHIDEMVFTLFRAKRKKWWNGCENPVRSLSSTRLLMPLQPFYFWSCEFWTSFVVS